MKKKQTANAEANAPRRKPKPTASKKAARTVVIVLIALLSLLLIAVIGAGATLIRYYNLMNIETLPEGMNDDSYMYTMDPDELSRLLALDNEPQPTEGDGGDEYPPDPTGTAETPVSTDSAPGTGTVTVDTASPATDPVAPGTTSPEAPGTTGGVVTKSPETGAPDTGVTTKTPDTGVTTKAPTTTPPPVTTRKPESAVIIDPTDDNVTNILLIGSDYVGTNGLSDAMIIVSINDSDHKIVLTSLMRDTYVYIPVNGGIYNKLNAAHSIGGASLLITTIKRNFGISIDDYVKIRFDDFTTVFDYLGGLDILLDANEISQINGSMPTMDGPFISSDLAGTYVHLNGVQILAHSRNRSTGGGGDFNRTRRQRDIILSAFNKLKTMNVAQLNSLLIQIFPLVTTDIRLGQFISYISSAAQYAKYEILSYRIPTDGYWRYYNHCVQITNMTATMNLWRETVYGQ